MVSLWRGFFTEETVLRMRGAVPVDLGGIGTRTCTGITTTLRRGKGTTIRRTANANGDYVT